MTVFTFDQGSKIIPTTTVIKPSADKNKDPRLSGKTLLMASRNASSFSAFFFALVTVRIHSSKPVRPTADIAVPAQINTIICQRNYAAIVKVS